MRNESIDFSRLLGFDTVSDEVSISVDFQDQAIDAKLGAKVGAEQMVAYDLDSTRAKG